MASERQKRLHKEIFEAIKAAKARPCARCHDTFPSVCMDFDHLPEQKKLFTIGSPANWTSIARIEAEIAKTQLLCSNCHRIVTWERKNGREAEPYQGDRKRMRLRSRFRRKTLDKPKNL